MPWVVLGLRVLLAGTFALAAATKVRGRRTFADTVREFGVPGRLAPAVAMLVPVAELVVAAALLPARTAAWGAAAAAALLAAFTIAVATNLALGRSPDCGCFGEVSRGPIGPRTIVRNLGLLTVAAAVLAAGRRADTISGAAWALRLTAVEGVLVGCAALGAGLAAWKVLKVWNGRRAVPDGGAPVSARPAPAPSYVPRPTAPGGLPVGAAAPPFALETLDGGSASLASLLAAGRPLLLVFVDPRCERCGELLPEIAEWQRDRAASCTVALLTRYSLAENRANAGRHGLGHVLLQRGREVMDAYRADATPSMVAVLADGTIASPLARWAVEMRALAERFAAGVSA